MIQSPCFIIAEMSANHNHAFAKAKRMVRIAKECGADAVLKERADKTDWV